MGFFVVIVRTPIGLLASILLLIWSLLVSLVYCVFFIFLAIFGKLTQINERLNPWLQAFNGVKCMPGLWRWVFRPYQGIFEEGQGPGSEPQSGVLLPPEGGQDADNSGLLNRYRAAMQQQQQLNSSDSAGSNPPASTPVYGAQSRPSSFSSHSSSDNQ